MDSMAEKWIRWRKNGFDDEFNEMKAFSQGLLCFYS